MLLQNDRQFADAERRLHQVEEALASESVFGELIKNLPDELREDLRGFLQIESRSLTISTKAYADAKNGHCESLFSVAGVDLGAKLIAARVCRGLSQKDLARKLGLKEQAVQRWEADRYRSITIGNFQMVCSALEMTVAIAPLANERVKWTPNFETSPAEASRVLRHAKKRKWIDAEDDDRILIRRIGDHVRTHGTPSLLRTGLNAKAKIQDWYLIAWKAQVTWLAERRISQLTCSYDPLDINWVSDCASLSQFSDGPVRVQRLLESKGIILIIEPPISGMGVDGAAFVVDGTPVIGMTLLKDTVDNFWFTLLHELAHIVLHYRVGLTAGFFDDTEMRNTDEFELQADRFASNLLIPEHVWMRSPARISNSVEPVVRLSKQLKIAPEIIFGRIRKERSNYRIFADKIGQGGVRKLFPGYSGVEFDGVS